MIVANDRKPRAGNEEGTSGTYRGESLATALPAPVTVQSRTTIFSHRDIRAGLCENHVRLHVDHAGGCKQHAEATRQSIMIA